jgi:hypothetical protein
MDQAGPRTRAPGSALLSSVAVRAPSAALAAIPLLASLAPTPARAQSAAEANAAVETAHDARTIIDRRFAYRGTALVLPAHAAQFHLAGDLLLDPDVFMLSYGLALAPMERLEVGTSLSTLLIPQRGENVLSNLEVFGRWAFRPDLALELAFRVPGAVPDFDRALLEIALPWKLDPNRRFHIVLEPALRVGVRGGYRLDLFLAALAQYDFESGVFLNLGTQLELGLAPDLRAPVSETKLPLVAGFGLRTGKHAGFTVRFLLGDLPRGALPGLTAGAVHHF